MTNLSKWLLTITPAHLLFIVVVGVLLIMKIGPQETELVALGLAAGVGIPSGSPSSSSAPAAPAQLAATLNVPQSSTGDALRFPAPNPPLAAGAPDASTVGPGLAPVAQP